MILLYKPPFKKFVKKQPRPLQLVIEDEVERIKGNPSIGKAKKGYLSEFKVHKFTFSHKQFLIAYQLKIDKIIFFLIGAHENFYRELKKYYKEVR